VETRFHNKEVRGKRQHRQHYKMQIQRSKFNGQQHNHQLQEHIQHAHSALICLTLLKSKAANQTLAGSFDFASGVLPPGITNLVELCNAWNKLTEEQRSEALPDISSLLNQIHVDSATITKITTCLLEVVSVG
jgi:hypothetical protein